jgi:hypothetical protein
MSPTPGVAMFFLHQQCRGRLLTGMHLDLHQATFRQLDRFDRTKQAVLEKGMDRGGHRQFPLRHYTEKDETQPPDCEA